MRKSGRVAVRRGLALTLRVLRVVGAQAEPHRAALIGGQPLEDR